MECDLCHVKAVWEIEVNPQQNPFGFSSTTKRNLCPAHFGEKVGTEVVISAKQIELIPFAKRTRPEPKPVIPVWI
jgi:hypothetical protein